MISKSQLKGTLLKSSFYEFFLEFWEEVSPTPLSNNWHIKYLCDVFQRVGEAVINRKPTNNLTVNIAPSSSKSTIISQLFPCWLWANDPSLSIISASYSMDLSLFHSQQSRDVINCAKYKRLFPHVVLKRDNDSKGQYSTTKKGMRLAVSVGSKSTGFHGDVLLLDDPQNVEMCLSDTKRKNSNEWITKTLSSRKRTENAPMCLVSQRLHPKDATNYFLSKYPDSKVISLPAYYTAENQTPVFPVILKEKYKQSGGLLDAKRRPFKVLETKKREVGTNVFQTQYLQLPTNPAAAILKKKWFGYYDPLQVLDGTQIFNYYLDTAYTDNKKNDPSAILSGFKKNNNYYLTGCAVKWLEFPELVKFIKVWVDQNGYTRQSKIYVEPKASGKSIVQQLKNETGLNIKEDKAPKESKLIRVHGISPIVETGRVYLPTGANWVEDFLNEIEAFPNGAHDDRVDCLTGLIRVLETAKKTPYIRNYTAVGQSGGYPLSGIYY